MGQNKTGQILKQVCVPRVKKTSGGARASEGQNSNVPITIRFNSRFKRMLRFNLSLGNLVQSVAV